jgi:hypothetical protein
VAVCRAVGASVDDLVVTGLAERSDPFGHWPVTDNDRDSSLVFWNISSTDETLVFVVVLEHTTVISSSL